MSRTAFKEAVEAHFNGDDPLAATDALADGVVFNSPVVYKPYEGRQAVAVLLGAVGEVFEDFSYVAELDSDDHKALIFRAKIGDREVQGLDLLRFDDDDRVVELTVMVRPMSGMLALAEAMRKKLEEAGAIEPA
jgi:hypothetical protein